MQAGILNDKKNQPKTEKTVTIFEDKYLINSSLCKVKLCLLYVPNMVAYTVNHYHEIRGI